LEVGAWQNEAQHCGHGNRQSTTRTTITVHTSNATQQAK
jgi:hypothetical protein